MISSRTNSGPMYATRTNSGPTYAKIIGKNNGSYPYRIGLNTLAHNGETFDATPKCGPGGLYYCEIKNVCEWLCHGDQLCIVEPVGQIVAIRNRFKTDRMNIVSMMSLLDIETWEFLAEYLVDNDCALRWAAQNGHLEVVKFLVDHGANVHTKNDYALQCAAEFGHLEVVKFLVEHGADVHAKDDNALQCAAEEGHPEIVKFLVEHGADVGAGYNRALRWAVEEGLLEIVKFLVDHGADVHAENDYAWQWAAWNGHHEIVEFLSEHGSARSVTPP